MEKEPVKQEDSLGCAVACVAFVLGISYPEAVELFANGKERVKNKANFYCPEIVQVLKEAGYEYHWKRVGAIDKKVLADYSIIFIQDGQYGHFLCRYQDVWMDPWVNRPYRPIKAEYITSLPKDPSYVIFKEG